MDVGKLGDKELDDLTTKSFNALTSVSTKSRIHYYTINYSIFETYSCTCYYLANISFNNNDKRINIMSRHAKSEMLFNLICNQTCTSLRINIMIRHAKLEI